MPTYLGGLGAVAAADNGLLELLARLAPGTPLRQGLERIIQQGSGALVVLGAGWHVTARVRSWPRP